MGLQEKKEEKRQALLDAAYSLFLERGTAKTSISDIAEHARVAKGTFYLYFTDKDAVMQALFGRISTRLLDEAYNTVINQHCATFTDEVLALADYIIDYFCKEQLVLRLVQHNFNWPTLETELAEGKIPVMANLMQRMRDSEELRGLSDRDIFNRLFVLLQLIGSVCYSSIIEHKPDTIANMKPLLFSIIRSTLQLAK